MLQEFFISFRASHKIVSNVSFSHDIERIMYICEIVLNYFIRSVLAVNVIFPELHDLLRGFKIRFLAYATLTIKSNY